MWDSSLTQKDRDNIERVQKNALRTILKGSYTTYENALELIDLETLEERRYTLCLKFAKKCQKNSYASESFKHKEQIHHMDLRNTEKIKVNKTLKSRYQISAVPFMQNILNKHYKEQEAQKKPT